MSRLIESCDEYDFDIIGRCLEGESTAQIVAVLSFSPESIRYRIRALAKVLGYKNREDLVAFVRGNQFRSAIWAE